MKLRRHGTFAGGIDLPQVAPEARGAAIEPCEGPADLSGPGGIAPGDETFDWRGADETALRDRLHGGALPVFASPGEPLAKWANRARRAQCDVLVANVMENEPHLSADHRLLVEHGREVVGGLEILRRAIGAGAGAVAVDRRQMDDYARAEPDLADRLIALTHKYPVGNDRVLTKVLTGRETPADGRTADVGLAVTDAATCFAAYRWVALGLRATHRVVALAGRPHRRPRNVWAPFGMLCMELAGPAKRLVHGGQMTGHLCHLRTVVGPGTRALIRLPAARAEHPRACVRCGWCVERCPARLNVPALNDAFELGTGPGPRLRTARACLGCGICSYVCPSCLPLAARVASLKPAAAPEPLPAGGPA